MKTEKEVIEFMKIIKKNLNKHWTGNVSNLLDTIEQDFRNDKYDENELSKGEKILLFSDKLVKHDKDFKNYLDRKGREQLEFFAVLKDKRTTRETIEL